MKYRISTEHNLAHGILKTSLHDLLAIFREMKIESVTVLFGFAWGNHFNNWHEMELSIEDIEPILDYVESREYGKMGGDDFILRFRMNTFYNEFTFCHHGGIDWEIINRDREHTAFSQLLNFFKCNFAHLTCEREIVDKHPGSKWERFKLEELSEFQ